MKKITLILLAVILMSSCSKIVCHGNPAIKKYRTSTRNPKIPRS